MSRIEYVTPEGLRVDGRRPNEPRAVHCRVGVLERADGSAFFQQGNTMAIAAVHGPRESPRSRASPHDRATVNCEFSLATFSTRERRRRARDRKTAELGAVIRQIFEGAIMTSLFPRSRIDIFVTVLQADGGVRSCAINAAALALAHAGVPMTDLVVSCAAGMLDGTPVLDMNAIEEGAAGPDVSVAALAKSGRVCSIQSDAKMAVDAFKQVASLASDGCRAVGDLMARTLRQYAADAVEARGALGRAAEL
eukprot:m51a1_g420 putative exonuclease rrp41 (251) ;mRNA; f:16825-17664